MPFTFHNFELSGLVLIEQQTFEDSRGFFKEVYKYNDFRADGIADVFVQDNYSVSGKNVVRGLHFQVPPKAQSKLITVLCGAILDVVVDLRTSSPTYREWATIELTAAQHNSLYIPQGFAHGFLALENDTCILYKTSAEYSPAHERGIRWNDPQIGIVWPIPSPHLSEKDATLPFIDELPETPF